MAKRFGGDYSPQGRTQHSVAPAPGAGPAKPTMGDRFRAWLLFVAPMPLVFKAFGRDPLALAMTLIAFAALILAAWLTREGLRAEAEYDARQVARRPALPRKIIASALSGIGVMLAAFTGMGGVFGPIALGLLATGCHFIAFGPDPLSDKGMEGIDRFQADRVARAVEDAEEHLEAMRDAILRARDRMLETRVERFAVTARNMFRTVEEDPRDLTAARKYMGVYLKGARDATVQYVSIATRGANAEARAKFEALLDDLETGFTSRTQKLLEDGQDNLDVEIEVLRERLARDANV
ncbi:5-bromo-4-chloroindolyl phosphate hydrolysis family protein [Halocynthiibacter styelae]|uniref:5-bromo-4-chloroindolyl phosphate hydrolysis family protein n=1 Tax=Halocynthiibacter styelae TaxID=2761955 RepID=A0A8J7IYS1_9RHOB|nr:5-bromo-4-chloroindolyl phosphate hydrolysis family protein [Paenihalocynthiibacter styelae]MBI1494704.1 5-bromo-4-chloroindolyl phosphate hydrolysis family protein [Paenihalocynthiibacter styelae]